MKEEKPVARAHDKYLFPSDLKNLVHDDMSKEDSIQVVQNYIDHWVRTQLMMRNAELNLAEEEQNLEKQIENYRASLLIYRYKQHLLNQKVDTIIPFGEIKAYYEENPSNFLLSDDIVKAVYVKVPLNAPQIWNLRSWYHSEDVDDIARLEQYCFEHAEEYTYFDDDWVYFRDIIQKTPREIDDTERFLRYNTRFEARDTASIHFVSIRDYRLAGTTAPLVMVQDDIKNILLNKRKLSFVNELENKIYRYAQNHNYFEIY
ncbi:MAG: hypothetical protein ACOC10_07735 [Bacteroidota bacterium]